tara:strand:+ start:723 stop:3170 length:2448 start_codon:yes stop_codon:yes gene_type:complete
MANGNGQYQVGDTFTDPNTGELLEILSIREDGQAEVRVVEETEDQSFGRGLLRTGLQGATFGFSDEAGGVLRGLGSAIKGEGFGKGYEAGRDEARQNLAAFRETNPMAAMAAEMVGGAVTGIGGAGALRSGAKLGTGLLRTGLRGAGGQAESARRTAQVLGEGGGLASKIGSAAKIGALEGTAYGVGAAGEDMGTDPGSAVASRLEGGVKGGLLGVLAGGAMGGIGHVASKARTAGREMKVSRPGDKGMKAGISRADEAIAESKINENPVEFGEKAKKWIEDLEIRAKSGEADAINELKRFRDSGSSLKYAGMRALAKDAETLAKADGAIPKILADSNIDLSETAAKVGGKTGKSQSLLRKTLDDPARTEVAQKTVKELQEIVGEGGDSAKRVFGDEEFATGGTRKRLNDLETRRADLASDDYADFSNLKKEGSWGNIIRDTDADGLSNILSKRYNNMANSGRDGESMLRRIEDAVSDIGQSRSMRDRGQRKPPTVSEMLSGQGFKRAYPEDVDQLRRGLKRIEAKAWKDKDADMAKEVKKFADDIDLSVRKHSKAYDTARKNYQARSRGIEIYDEASKGYNTPEDMKFAFEQIKTKAPEGVSAEGLQDLQTAFKQGVVDNISDNVDKLMLSDDTGASAMRFVKAQAKLLENAGILDAKTAKRLNDRVEIRVEQTKTTLRNRGITGDQLIQGGVTAGKEELTAGAYLAAGQPGAAGRTMVASGLYGEKGVRNVANAMSERLAQEESKGLLGVAETILKSEQDLIGQGLNRRKGIAGLLGFGQAPLQELAGNRYGGYRPRDIRVRQRSERLRELER